MTTTSMAEGTALEWLKDVFANHANTTAFLCNGREISYGQLSQCVARWDAEFEALEVSAGEVVALEGDFTPETVSLLLALVNRGCIVVPHNISNTQERAYRFETATVERWFSVDENELVTSGKTGIVATHEFYETLRERQHPGLVLFTSGSSGLPKAAVHDFTGLLSKFTTKRRALKTLNFLLFDHWGGLNTLFHTLSNAGVVIPVYRRNADEVCALIAKHRVELLPASPTFLNLMLLSGAYLRYDLSSLQAISYGTEPMPASTLARLREAFPAVRLHQTYGLIELGVLRSKSKETGSLWVQVGGEGYETRIIDGLLQIKAQSAMLGYLNAPSPFTDDGWFMTGDAVEVDGDYIRILGRKSEMINVGGDKVAPSEVESVIQELSNVAEVLVFGEKHPLVGNIVCAKVRLIADEDAKEFSKRLRKFCGERLQKYKVPVKVTLVEGEQHNNRFKKIRVQ